MTRKNKKNKADACPMRPLTDGQMEFILTFSSFKDFNAVLDCVQTEGLEGLKSPALREHLQELGSFLPDLSPVGTLLFSYFYVNQEENRAFSTAEVEEELRTPGLYLRYEQDWQRLVKLGLLTTTPDGKFTMPQKVTDAVAVMDIEYYFPQERPPVVPAKHKKELFWRLVHDKDSNPWWQEMFERGEVCK